MGVALTKEYKHEVRNECEQQITIDYTQTSVSYLKYQRTGTSTTVATIHQINKALNTCVHQLTNNYVDIALVSMKQSLLVVIVNKTTKDLSEAQQRAAYEVKGSGTEQQVVCSQ